ncbi:hypothetical protein GCM10027160_34670 [Streptomyces calidiresistens]|uniref:Uncharacterized protein n=1 Tax=Streptomyces calidiresistens TaxID=1485586 RepID=A0A7W3T198_9ACTN|nr:hypothetical protein [Streptomyces calidiresistens]MBB0229051.1 hypothetical protein [Streptomyces calidiresistens]
MTRADSRLVQTAVIESKTSHRAILLPKDADELALWRRRHPHYSYWCGLALGGCGNELSDRLYRNKVCHFAHHPNTSCHRTETGVNSADHLFVKSDLSAWAGRHRWGARVSLDGRGAGPGDAVDFRTREDRRHVRFQFRILNHPEWVAARERLKREAAGVDWVFGPGAVHPETMEELYDERGHLLRFRCETEGAARRVRLRAEEPGRSTDWVPLDACAMTPEGLWVPGLGPRRRTGSAEPARRMPGQGSDRPRRSRQQQVEAVREALVKAAGLRTRPTWEVLARTAGEELSELSDAERTRLLTDLDRKVGKSGRPFLPALLRTDGGGTPSYVGPVVEAVGCGFPATAEVLRHWCRREIDRAFAVYGTPPRIPLPRFGINKDGHLVAGDVRSPQPRVILHRESGAFGRDDPQEGRLRKAKEVRGELARARKDKAVRRLAAFLKEAEEVLPHLSRAQSGSLRAEMIEARTWLRSHLTDEVKRAGGPRRRRKVVTSTRQSGKARKAGGAKGGKKRETPAPGTRPRRGTGGG